MGFALFLLITGELTSGIFSSDTSFYNHTSKYTPVEAGNLSQISNRPSSILNSDVFQKSEILKSESNNSYKNSINQISQKHSRTDVASHNTRNPGFNSKSVSNSVAVYNVGSTSASNAYSNDKRNFNASHANNSPRNIDKLRTNFDRQILASNSYSSISKISESDMMAVNNTKQSVFILPGTGGNATEEDSVPLGDGKWILIILALIYAVFKVHKLKKIVF